MLRFGDAIRTMDANKSQEEELCRSTGIEVESAESDAKDGLRLTHIVEAEVVETEDTIVRNTKVEDEMVETKDIIVCNTKVEVEMMETEETIVCNAKVEDEVVETEDISVCNAKVEDEVKETYPPEDNIVCNIKVGFRPRRRCGPGNYTGKALLEMGVAIQCLMLLVPMEEAGGVELRDETEPESERAELNHR